MASLSLEKHVESYDAAADSAQLIKIGYAIADCVICTSKDASWITSIECSRIRKIIRQAVKSQSPLAAVDGVEVWVWVGPGLSLGQSQRLHYGGEGRPGQGKGLGLEAQGTGTGCKAGCGRSSRLWVSIVHFAWIFALIWVNMQHAMTWTKLWC